MKLKILFSIFVVMQTVPLISGQLGSVLGGVGNTLDNLLGPILDPLVTTLSSIGVTDPATKATIAAVTSQITSLRNICANQIQQISSIPALQGLAATINTNCLAQAKVLRDSVQPIINLSRGLNPLG